MSNTPPLRLELNQLLNNINANRETIYLAMHDLAMCKVKRFHFRNLQDVEDVVSESVMYVMGRLHKYDPGRHAACAYFGLMLRRRMMLLMRKMKNAEMSHDHCAAIHRDNSILDSAPSRRLPRTTGRRWRNTFVRGEEDRKRIKNVLDEALEKACQVVDSSGPGDDVQPAELAIGVLQHVRKALLGRFNRIQAERERDARLPIHS